MKRNPNFAKLSPNYLFQFRSKTHHPELKEEESILRKKPKDYRGALKGIDVKDFQDYIKRIKLKLNNSSIIMIILLREIIFK